MVFLFNIVVPLFDVVVVFLILQWEIMLKGYAVGQLTTAAVPFWVSSENKCFCDQREILVTHIYRPQQHDAASLFLLHEHEVLCIDRTLAGPSGSVIS